MVVEFQSSMQLPPNMGVHMLRTGQVALSTRKLGRLRTGGQYAQIYSETENARLQEDCTLQSFRDGDDDRDEEKGTDPEDHRAIMAVLIHEVPMDEDDVAVVTAARRKKSHRLLK